MTDTPADLPMHLVLDETAFRELVAGRVVTLADGRVKLILSDIGWWRMFQAIEDALIKASSK